MQTSSGNSQGNPDERVNGVEDSPMMTIEYLRARLHAERSVSKAEKERADELAQRVTELEERLRLVTLQRNRAEKATLDVLSYLASHGITDISEVYESESDQEVSLRKSNVGKCVPKTKEENFSSLESKEGDEVSSGSDHDSTPSSGRSLSWRGRKDATWSFEKKSFESSRRRGPSLAHVSSLPKQRSGKSCRQIKRRELRSVVEELRHDSAKSENQGNHAMNSADNFSNYLAAGSTELERFSEGWTEKSSHRNGISLSSRAQSSECDASSSHKHECNGEMERALEHQVLLIGHYEAQEKAQRDWEERCGENIVNTPDSCEPGNHSDVTEDRDENKATVPCSNTNVAGRGHDQEAGIQTHFQGKNPLLTHFNSFKFAPSADTGCSQSYNYSEMNTSLSSPPDFAFSVGNSHQCHERASPSFNPSTHNSPDIPQPENLIGDNAVVSHKEPQRLGAVLGALQEAKSLLKRQINRSPGSSGSFGQPNNSIALRDGDRFNVPVGCPGLFKVPTDCSETSRNKLLVPDDSAELNNSLLSSGYPLLKCDRYASSHVNHRFSVPSAGLSTSSPVIGVEPGNLDQHARFGFQFTSASQSYPAIQDSSLGMFPNKRSSVAFLRSEAGIPPTGSPFYYDYDRPNLYR